MVAEALGADVNWDEKKQQVIVQTTGDASKVEVGQPVTTLPDKDKFLDSTKGHAFQVIAWKFTKALLA